MRKFLFIIALILSFSYLAVSQTFVDFTSIPKSGTVMIFAHQDDDFIWMLPWWPKCEKFIGGAMPATPTYKTVIHNQQIFLDNNDYEIDYETNWRHPWEDITQYQYQGYYWAWFSIPSFDYLANDHVKAFWDFENEEIVTRNEINKIKAKIELYIADENVQRIITHNNWGEGWNTHHRALNTAVRELAVKYKKDVWMLNCYLDEGINFIDNSVPQSMTYTLGNFDQDLFDNLKANYEDPSNYVWTWSNHPSPSDDHPFIKIVDNGVDKSGILLPGTIVTITGPAQSKPGAYIFDGDDDYMTLPGNNYPEFTISMWVKPDVIKSMDISSMKEYPSAITCNRSFFITNDGKVSAQVNGDASQTVTSESSLTAGNWSHILITAGGSSLKIYFNGVLQNATSTGTISGYSTPEFVLGQAQNSTSFFKGQISDVRLYDYVLSAEEIQAVSGTTPPALFTITATSGPDGTINPSGARIVNQGSNRVYSIVANPYFQVADVEVDGISIGAVTSYTFYNIMANHSITATFTYSTSSIALNKPASCESNESGRGAEFANDADGTNNSYWAASPYSKWWKVDLQHDYNVSLIVIRNYVDNNRYYHYEIYGSSDDNTYIKIAEKTNNDPATDVGDFYYLNNAARYLKVNMTYNSANVGVHISDFRVYGALHTAIWTGNHNNDWHNSSNWTDGIKPVSATNVIIPSCSNYPVITDAVECKDLTINASAELEIAYSGKLTVTGTLTNYAGVNGLILRSLLGGTASIINSTSGVGATVERYIDNSGTASGISWDWHLLSSPVTEQEIWPSFVPSAPNWHEHDPWDFYYFNPNASNAVWVNIKKSDGSYNSNTFDLTSDYAGFGETTPPTMIPGRGYLVAYDDEDLKSFTGNLNTGEVKVHVSNTENLYNLVGNPYPSVIDWKATSGWIRDNLEGGNTNCSYWIYNEDWGNYGVFNAAGSDGSGTCGVTRFIAPEQAFFVKTAETSQTQRDLLVMNNSIRVSDVQLWLKSIEENGNFIKLKLTTDRNAFADEMIIEFNQLFGGDQGCEKIASINEQAPEIYSVKGGNNFSIDHYSDIFAGQVVDLSVKCAIQGSYKIRATNIKKFTLFNKVYLEDLKIGNKINLKETNSYTFSGNPYDIKARFKIVFSEPIGIEEHDSIQQIKVFSSGKDICIKASQTDLGICDVIIYDISGRIVFIGRYNPNIIKITTLNVPGIYIVKVRTKDRLIVNKVIIPK